MGVRCTYGACDGVGLTWEADGSEYRFDDLDGNFMYAWNTAPYACFTIIINKNYPRTDAYLRYEYCTYKRATVCQFKCA